jgi:hypothetical protein
MTAVAPPHGAPGGVARPHPGPQPRAEPIPLFSRHMLGATEAESDRIGDLQASPGVRLTTIIAVAPASADARAMAAVAPAVGRRSSGRSDEGASRRYVSRSVASEVVHSEDGGWE